MELFALIAGVAEKFGGIILAKIIRKYTDKRFALQNELLEIESSERIDDKFRRDRRKVEIYKELAVVEEALKSDLQNQLGQAVGQ